jgi:hypothetical protein
MAAKRNRRQTPGVIRNNEPQIVRRRYDELRQKRFELAKSAGFETQRKLEGIVFKALEQGRYGWYMLEAPQPCAKCSTPTSVAELYKLSNGWLMLKPVCVKCNQSI